MREGRFPNEAESFLVAGAAEELKRLYGARETVDNVVELAKAQ